MVKPYTDVFSSNRTERIRTFDEHIDEQDLVWHRDSCNREITVLEGENWKLQFDNKLPFVMEKGRLYRIPEMTYHRVLKGSGTLRLKIWDETD